MAPMFNHISLDQLKRLDLDIGIFANPECVEKIEPNVDRKSVV
mgnify:CR=1 FL=1